MTGRFGALWTRRTTSERVTLVVWLLIAAQLVFRTWAVAGSWFYSDDFLFLGKYGIGEADSTWFFTPHNIHIMPLGLWLSTWVSQAGAFAWWAAAAQIVTMQALASIAFWWMLRTIFGDRPGILPPMAIFLFLPASLGSVVWWAASLNQLPHQIALFGFIAMHVRYLRTHRALDLTGASLALVLGLSAYTKSLLFLPLVVVLTIGFFVEGRWWVRPFRALARWWKGWLAYGTILAVYVGYYLAITPSAPAPTRSAVLDTLQMTMVRTVAPSLLGGPWNWQDMTAAGGVGPRLFADTPWGLVALAWSLLGAFTLWTLMQRRRAGWAPVMLIAYALGSGLLVAYGRAGAFGTDVAALEVRYHADLPAVAALVVALAWLPAIGSPEPVTPRPEVGLPALPRRRWVVIVAFVAVMGSAWSSVRYVAPWHEADLMPQRAWVDTATAELSGRPTDIADSAVPDFVVWSAAFPGNLVSHVLSPLKDRVRTVDEGIDLQMIGPTGALAPAHVSGVPRSQPGPVEDCGYAIEGESVTIPIAAVINFEFWMTVNFVAAGDVDLTITAGDNSTTTNFPSGAHTFVMHTYGAYDAVTFTPSDDTTVCIDGINVGALSPLELP